MERVVLEVKKKEHSKEPNPEVFGYCIECNKPMSEADWWGTQSRHCLECWEETIKDMYAREAEEARQKADEYNSRLSWPRRLLTYLGNGLQHLGAWLTQFAATDYAKQALKDKTLEVEEGEVDAIMEKLTNEGVETIIVY